MTKKKEPIKLETVENHEITTPMRRYRVQFDFDIPYTGKKMSQEVVTQPDMNLTVRQLLENHTRGIDSKVQAKEPLYFEVPVPTIKDITDIHEFRDHLQQKLDYTKEFIKQEEAQRKEEEQREEKENNALKKKLAKERAANKQLDLEEQISEVRKQVSPK